MAAEQRGQPAEAMSRKKLAEPGVLSSEGAIASIAGVALGTGDEEEQRAAQYESHLLRHGGLEG